MDGLLSLMISFKKKIKLLNQIYIYIPVDFSFFYNQRPKEIKDGRDLRIMTSLQDYFSR